MLLTYRVAEFLSTVAHHLLDHGSLLSDLKGAMARGLYAQGAAAFNKSDKAAAKRAWSFANIYAKGSNDPALAASTFFATGPRPDSITSRRLTNLLGRPRYWSWTLISMLSCNAPIAARLDGGRRDMCTAGEKFSPETLALVLELVEAYDRNYGNAIQLLTIEFDKKLTDLFESGALEQVVGLVQVVTVAATEWTARAVMNGSSVDVSPTLRQLADWNTLEALARNQFKPTQIVLARSIAKDEMPLQISVEGGKGITKAQIYRSFNSRNEWIGETPQHVILSPGLNRLVLSFVVGDVIIDLTLDTGRVRIGDLQYVDHQPQGFEGAVYRFDGDGRSEFVSSLRERYSTSSVLQSNEYGLPSFQVPSLPPYGVVGAGGGSPFTIGWTDYRKIQIESDPTGASILINGRPRGTTPRALLLQLPTIRMILRKSGLLETVAQINLTEPVTEIYANLNPINLKEQSTLEEAARFTDLTLYEGHLYPGDDTAKSRQLPENEALRANCKYTLGVAIRGERSGVGSAIKAPFAVLNPRQTKEDLTIIVIAKQRFGPVLTIDEPVAAITWPYNNDSDSAFFRITVQDTLPAPESQVAVEVSLYHENLDLLDVVNLKFSVIADLGAEAPPSRIEWPRTSKAAQPRLDPDAAVRLLNVSVAPATDGYQLDFLFKRERGEEIKVPFETHLKLGDLDDLLAKVRDFWTRLAIGIYADQLSVARSNWEETLGRLRDIGVEAWKLLFGTRTGSKKGAPETIGDLLARMELAAGTHVQISYRSNLEDFVFPWSILHPPPRESGMKVDPLQFWGARYQIEQVSEGASRDLLDSKPVGITVLLDPAFGQTKVETEMFEKFRTAAGNSLIITPVSDKAALLAALGLVPPSHLYYFFCHGYTPAGRHAILPSDGVKILRENLEQRSPDERKPWEILLSLTAKMADEPWIFTGSSEITESELKREAFFRGRRPIIFLNMCQSAALLPSMTTGFVRLFLDRDAAAVIGTESPMTSVFAHAFGLELLRHFFGGSDLDTALWQARRYFLADEVRNPLGLAYTLYGRATATLGSGPPLICALTGDCKEGKHNG